MGAFFLVFLVSLTIVQVSFGDSLSNKMACSNVGFENFSSDTVTSPDIVISPDAVTSAGSVISPDSVISAGTDVSVSAEASSQVDSSRSVEALSKSLKREGHTEPPYRIVLRSLVYPGWGQLYNEKYVKALVVFASEATFLGMIYTESREASRAYEDHLVAPDLATSERLYAEYEKHFERRDSLIWWTAGLVLFSLADAYVDAHLFTFDEEFGEPGQTKDVSLTTGGYSKGGFVGIKYVF